MTKIPRSQATSTTWAFGVVPARRWFLLAVAALLSSAYTPAVVVRPLDLPDEPIAGCTVIEGARLLTGTPRLAASSTATSSEVAVPPPAEIPAGYVILAGGRVEAVGAGAPPARPECRRVDGTDKVVTPGLIDTHSHLGVYPWPSAKAHADGNEMTDPNTAGVRAEESIWPQDPGFQRALRGGVTTAHILPGSGNLIGGRGVTIHQGARRSARAMRFPGAPGSVKMACGENPKNVYGGKGVAPMSRMGNLRGQRQAFLNAKAALNPTDLSGDALRELMAGTLLAQVHCYRADEMVAFLGLADEMGFKVRSFHHALEAYKIADVLADREVSVSTWADWWGFKMEAFDGIPENAAMVHVRGGRAIIHSDSAIGIQRLNQEAGKAMAAGQRAGFGVDERDAIRWITANSAWALGVESEIGTLEVGKRADVVLWDRSTPFSVYARAQMVWVDGHVRHDSAAPGLPWSDFEVAP